MDLKKIDEEYKKSKLKLQGLDKVKQKIEDLKKEIITLRRKVQDLDIAKMRADEDNDKQAAQQIEEDLKDPLAKLNSARNSLQKLQLMIQNAEKAVDDRLAELSNDPELQEYLNTVIGKKFSRQILHKQKEKETLLSHNEQLEIIKEAAKKDQYVMNTIKGIEGYTKKIEELQSKTMTPQDQRDLLTAKAKLADRKKDLSTYFKGTISDEVIESLTSFDDISRKIKSNIRQAKGIDKQIAHYETALDRIGFASPRTAPETDRSATSTSTSQILGGIPIERPESSAQDSERVGGSNSSWIDERGSDNLPDTQPKWYQFVKRFKNWINRRKAGKEVSIEDEVAIESEIKENPKFRDAMKYDIIKDYEARLEQDLLRDAKAERKASEISDSERPGSER